jgi:nucleoside-diphosphate-sugar epimerase
MKIFVTGASGFLGGSFVEAAAAAGHTVTASAPRASERLARFAKNVVVRDVLELSEGDLAEGVDAVVHFAAATSGREDYVLRVSVTGTVNLLRAARNMSVPRFVHISSISVYPWTVDRDDRCIGGLALESYPERRGLYARSKTLTDEAIERVVRAEGLGSTELTIIRPGLVFGEEMAGVLAGIAVELPLGIAVGLGRASQSVPFVDVEYLNAVLLGVLSKQAQPGAADAYDVLAKDLPTKAEFLRYYCELSAQARRRIWVPYPAAAAAAIALDAFQKFQRPSARPALSRARYTVRRLYRFEPRELPRKRLCDEVDKVASSSVRLAIASALSGERKQADPDSTGRADARELAKALLRCVDCDSPLTGPQLPVVLVGAGRIAHEMHLPILRETSEYEVRAVVDPAEELARAFASQVRASSVVPSIDGLEHSIWEGATAVLATPGFTHHQLALEALGHGADVLVEKPAVIGHDQYADVNTTAMAARRTVTLFQNHRLRPAALALWRFVLEHDVGDLVRAQVTLHSQRLVTERARWMREEKRHRVLLMEIGVHLLDLAVAVGGEIDTVPHLTVVERPSVGATVSITGIATMRCGAELFIDLNVTGTAQRYQVVLEFERAACALDLFPDHFRILPRRSNPIDDVAADTARLVSGLWRRVRPNENGFPKRALPHRQIYREHRRRLRTSMSESPFSLDAMKPTLKSLFTLAERVYPPNGAHP